MYWVETVVSGRIRFDLEMVKNSREDEKVRVQYADGRIDYLRAGHIRMCIRLFGMGEDSSGDDSQA